MEEKLLAEGVSEWNEICTVSHKVAMEVLGKRGRPHPEPWLVGHEQDKEELDTTIRKLKEKNGGSRTKRERKKTE